jgi:hypothetical protein
MLVILHTSLPLFIADAKLLVHSFSWKIYSTPFMKLQLSSSKSSPLDTILNKINPVHTFIFLLYYQFNITLPFKPVPPL